MKNLRTNKEGTELRLVSSNDNLARNTETDIDSIINDVNEAKSTENNVENLFAQKSYISDRDLDLLFNKTTDENFDQLTKRINDYDSNIVKQNISQTIKEKSLKIELIIQETESAQKKIQEQIDLLKRLDLDYDKKRLANLEDQKVQLDKILQLHKNEYKRLGLAHNITETLTDTINKTKDGITSTTDKAAISFSGVINKIFPKIGKKILLKDEINKLTLVEKNLNEMASTKSIPFGEEEENNDKFELFFGKATELDAKIKKLLDEEKENSRKIEKAFNLGSKNVAKTLRRFNK